MLQKTKPVQDYLRMPLTAERDQLQLCSHLPRPLFVLFNQLKGYGAACDPSVKVTVVGDFEEAKNFRSVAGQFISTVTVQAEFVRILFRLVVVSCVPLINRNV